MKIFGFVKKVFFIGWAILSSFISINLLSCISMSNQPCKARPENVMLTVIILYFILSALKQVNVVALIIILMIRMREYVFLMLWNI